MTAFVITPLGQIEADAIRDEIGSGQRAARLVTLEEPGAPCRSCLQAAAAGDRMWLLSYQPFRGESFYAVPSPIYLHADSCTPYECAGELPALVRTGERAVRSYDAGHGLVDGLVASGAEIETAIEKLLADDRVEYLHVYSATAGCYTCRVDR